jgi:cation:H+ antiporter
MLWLYIFIFIASCILLYFSGEWVVGGLTRIAKFLGWREFVVAFFMMALASSLPNFFVGTSSILHKIPQLSFGDIVGGNVVDLTLAIALAVLFAKNRSGIPAESKMVQTTSFFVLGAAVLPLLLIVDGVLSQIDGILLIAFFVLYVSWLFSKKERFTKIYDGNQQFITKQFGIFLKDIGKILLGIAGLLLAAEGIVNSAKFFAINLNLPIALVGILIVGLGNSLPEIYFAITSAKKGEVWMILGDLMGAVIIPATLILGIISLICPIEIADFSPFAIARIFLIISALFFFFSVKTDHKITKKEAIFLLLIYFAFIISEIFIS